MLLGNSLCMLVSSCSVCVLHVFKVSSISLLLITPESSSGFCSFQQTAHLVSDLVLSDFFKTA